VFAFGSLFGDAFYGYRTGGLDGWGATGMLYIWGATAVIGLALIGFKAHLITARRLRTWVTLGDGVVLLAALALIAVLPSFMGVVRGLILLALFTPHIVWLFKTLETIERAEG
jgi:hypothetical protein